MLVGLHLDQIPLRLQVRHKGFPAGVTVHALVLPAVFVDGGILVEDVDDGEIVPLAHLKVVGVVGGGDLHHAGAEVHLAVFVPHHRDFPVTQG